MSFATLNGHACTRARVQAPAWGAWWADVDLAEPEALSVGARVTLALADKTFSGTIVSGGAAEGRAAYRIAGGAGGWGRELPAKAYRSDTGVKASNVIGDAASACGETIASPPATKLGPHYARAAGAASAVLHALAPRAWYVDFDGVTRFGARASVTYAGDGARSRVSPATAVVEIATDEIGTLVPGVIVDGSAPASDVEYMLDARKLRVRVYASTRASRNREALRRLVASLFPEIRYSGLFEFRVVTQQGERLNLQPVRAALGLPDLSGVPVRPGMAGLRATVLPGSLVLVAFADRDPSRPGVVAHDATDAPGWMPLALELGEGPTLGVARVTDPVVAGAFGGSIVAASARIKAGL